MSTYQLVVRGCLVLEDGVVAGELGINNGVIETFSPEQAALNGERTLDFEDCYIFPGLIDAHVHCYTNPEEGFINNTASAAVGGFTTILDMPYDSPDPITSVERFKDKVALLEQEAIVDVGLWATVAKGGTWQIGPLAEAGAIAFKLSTFEADPYRFPRIPDHEVLQSLQLAGKIGLPVAFHAENGEIIGHLIEEYSEKGNVAPRAHMETRPPVSESVEVLKLLEMAYWTQAKLHIVHVSHPRTIELIQAFQRQGVRVTAETCYPYFLKDVGDLERLGTKAKMNPPLRQPEDAMKMWEYVKAGAFNMITSDHVPWDKSKKDAGKENIFKAAPGLPGLEIMASLIFDRGVAKGQMTPVQYAQLLSQHPAEVFQIEGKGRIAPGYDADFTVIDPHAHWVIDEQKFRTNAKITPFHGQKVQGKIIHTIVRGCTVYDGDEVVQKPGFGKFVANKVGGSK
ncbi:MULTISPECIES: dihydroorotase [Paenibacillus]|uniref:Amidohydrolase family protein n=1 Tax=Paenibacillus agri TaxID=2744309 RepID=A0A850EGA1_9BACL|nr:amidohydrolase family protein [Paenibacillus agri]NUU60353.1 amidohydrolase family protein [Paenibacillus agri]